MYFDVMSWSCTRFASCCWCSKKVADGLEGVTPEPLEAGARIGMSGSLCTQSELAMPRDSLEDQPSGLIEQGQSCQVDLQSGAYLGYAWKACVRTWYSQGARMSRATVCLQGRPPQSPAGNLRGQALQRLQQEMGGGMDECHPTLSAFLAKSNVFAGVVFEDAAETERLKLELAFFRGAFRALGQGMQVMSASLEQETKLKWVSTRSAKARALRRSTEDLRAHAHADVRHGMQGVSYRFA